MKDVKSKNYTLRTKQGQWLGQVVLTSDGMFASVTDYGNLSYAWRSFGDEDFRRFILSLNMNYFGDKMVQGLAYIAHSKKIEASCYRFAEQILPALHEAILAEMETESGEVWGNE